MENETTKLPRIRVKGGDLTQHPWLSYKIVSKPNERVAPGSVVDFVDSKDRWVGRGFYNGHARVRGRVLTQDPGEAIDTAFFERHLGRAIQWRRNDLALDAATDAYRLVHSEADGLGGLVIDRFGSLLVIEYFAHGMFRFRNALKEILGKHFSPVRFYSFAERHVQKQESFDLRPEDPPEPVQIREQGLKFFVSPGTGHKTGFFLDQRENRLLFSKLTAGRNVLDLCCHTGAFAIYAKFLGRAEAVTGVDADPEAIEKAEKNARLNSVAASFFAEDLFDWLRVARERKSTFNAIVLDPAKQTRSSEGVREALRRYYAMNSAALSVAAKGALFVTCSCSGWIQEGEFIDTVRDAAFRNRRELQIFKVTGAGADHPFLAHVPEGRYLKTLWCRVI